MKGNASIAKKGVKVCQPSLRRHYPVQVLRVLSQPFPDILVGIQHPGELIN